MPRWIFSPFFAFFLTIGSIFLIFSLIQTDAQLEESATIVDIFSEEIEDLRAQVAVEELTALEATSSAAQERIIRDELLMQQPGEYVVQLPNLEDVEQQRTESLLALQEEQSEKEPKNALDAWIRLIVY